MFIINHINSLLKKYVPSAAPMKKTTSSGPKRYIIPTQIISCAIMKDNNLFVNFLLFSEFFSAAINFSYVFQ